MVPEKALAGVPSGAHDSSVHSGAVRAVTTASPFPLTLHSVTSLVDLSWL